MCPGHGGIIAPAPCPSPPRLVQQCASQTLITYCWVTIEKTKMHICTETLSDLTNVLQQAIYNMLLTIYISSNSSQTVTESEETLTITISSVMKPTCRDYTSPKNAEALHVKAQGAVHSAKKRCTANHMDYTVMSPEQLLISPRLPPW